jgi:hypothetical protein
VQKSKGISQCLWLWLRPAVDALRLEANAD